MSESRALTSDAGLIMIMKQNPQRRIAPDELEKLIKDGPSWLRYLVMTMNNSGPVRMTVSLGTRIETIFVAFPGSIRPGDAWEDLDRKYPET